MRSVRAKQQERGYELERFLIDCARIEQLDAEYSYRGSGEQVDGYFVVDHRHFLLEAKWSQKPMPASDVFAFQGKLRGKLVGTLGLFASMSGFSEETPGALVSGKELNVLLADASDVLLALSAPHSFHEMVRVKMRAAAKRGDVYYEYKRWLDARRKS